MAGKEFLPPRHGILEFVAGSKEADQMLRAFMPHVGRLTLEEIDAPCPPAPNQVLLEVERAGICKTDLHILHGHFPVHFPVQPGHEFTGRVLAVGSEVDDLSRGERVAVDPAWGCGQCGPCRGGRPHLCLDFRSHGNTDPGGLAEQVLVDRAQLHAVGDLDPEETVWAEPLACVLHGFRRGSLQPGEEVLILGAGPNGAMAAQVARALGASRVVVTDPHAEKLALLAGIPGVTCHLVQKEDPSALPPEGPFDLVFDTVASAITAITGVELLKPGGRLLLFGVADPRTRVEVSLFDLYRSERTITASNGVGASFRDAVDLLSTRKVALAPLISHRLPLRALQEAFDLLDRGKAFKVVLQP